MLLRIVGTFFTAAGCVAFAADPPPPSPQQPAGFPAGMVAMFAGPTCPDGWTEASLTKGRIPVGAATPAEASSVLGEALEQDQARPHEHGFTATHTLRGSPMPLRHECCFLREWIRPQTIKIEGQTDSRDSELPLYAIRMCTPVTP